MKLRYIKIDTDAFQKVKGGRKYHLAPMDTASDFGSKYGQKTACGRTAGTFYSSIDFKRFPDLNWCKICLKRRNLLKNAKK